MIRYERNYEVTFRSRIDSTAVFTTPEAAREFDRTVALSAVMRATEQTFLDAFKRRNDLLALSLKFLAEDSDLTPDFEEPANV